VLHAQLAVPHAEAEVLRELDMLQLCLTYILPPVVYVAKQLLTEAQPLIRQILVKNTQV